MNTTIQSYQDMIYDSRPVKFSELMNNKYDGIHKELFLDALDSAIKRYIECCHDRGCNIDPRYRYGTVKEFKEQVNIIELKNTEYWMPSSVLWRTKAFPYRIISLVETGSSGIFMSSYKRGQMSLAPWWNMYQKFDDKSVLNVKMGGDQIEDFRVIYLNYVQGEATLRSKTTDKEIVVPFEYLNENTEIDDSMLLSNTFTSMLNTNRI